MSVPRAVLTAAENPYRKEVLKWYRKCLQAAFAVPWDTDADALYVLEETRRLFNRNKGITDVDRIKDKLREVEMRYELALHYRIPYPRPTNKPSGSMPESSAPYAPYLDSSYDHAVNPNTGVISEGSTNFGTQGGKDDPFFYIDDGFGFSDVEGRADMYDTNPEPPTRSQR